MPDAITNFGTVTKIDLTSSETSGFVEIEYGSSEMIRMIMLAMEQLPSNDEALNSAKEKLIGILSGNCQIGMIARPVLNKATLKEAGNYLVDF